MAGFGHHRKRASVTSLEQLGYYTDVRESGTQTRPTYLFTITIFLLFSNDEILQHLFLNSDNASTVSVVVCGYKKARFVFVYNDEENIDIVFVFVDSK